MIDDLLLKGFIQRKYPDFNLFINHFEYRAGMSVERLTEMIYGAIPSVMIPLSSVTLTLGHPLNFNLYLL